MNFYWEDATKRIQKELHDPLLKVEFNDKTQKYEILKWIAVKNTIPIPGILFSSGNDLVHFSYPSGYWSYQMNCVTWDGRIFERMRRSRPDYKDLKMIFHDRKVDEEKVDKSLQNEKRDLSREYAKDCWNCEHPKIYSFAKKAN